MMASFRAFIITLVGTILLLRHHLYAIGSQWQSHPGADRHPGLVVNEGGAYIELDSFNPHANANANAGASVQPFSSASPTPSSSTISPRFRLPLDRSQPSGSPFKTKPETIPVRVPGQDFGDDSLGWKPLSKHKSVKPKVRPKTDRIVVMPATFLDDVSWLDYELPEWQHAVYMVDDPDAELTVSQNKGKESNVYLQYITDHYDNLPQYMVFIHSHQYAHHIEFEEQDNALTVRRLQLGFLKKSGYVSLRCNWEPGCPAEVQPFRQLDGRTTEIAFAGAWMQIFNNTDIPNVIAAPCCAQFAVTREQVLARPLSDYQQYHQWLMETELDDETSGRVFEYLWHIIFGKDPVFCPTMEQCYLDVYATEYVPPPPEPELGFDFGEDDSFDDLNDTNVPEANGPLRI